MLTFLEIVPLMVMVERSAVRHVFGLGFRPPVHLVVELFHSVFRLLDLL